MIAFGNFSETMVIDHLGGEPILSYGGQGEGKERYVVLV